MASDFHTNEGKKKTQSRIRYQGKLSLRNVGKNKLFLEKHNYETTSTRLVLQEMLSGVIRTKRETIII